MSYVRRTNRNASVRRSTAPATYRASRATAYTRTSQAARTRAVARARAAPTRGPSVINNMLRASANANAIKKLQFNQWGRIQSQVSQSSEALVVHRDHPVLFHVNNPVVNHHGPYLWTLGATLGEPVPSNSSFDLYQGNTDHDFNDLDDRVKVNGPTLKLLWATYQFKFEGFAQDCRIRVDFIRQKKMVTDFYNQNIAKNFLPDTLDGFKGIAGFSPNEIDKSKFQVLKTKYLYINAASSSNIVDTAEDRATTEATTAPTKFCKVSLKLNKILKQIVPSQSESSGGDNSGEGRPQTEHPHHSSWCYDNQHPLSNVWCLISCDDTRGLTEDVLGEHVKVSIIRKMTWQDKM